MPDIDIDFANRDDALSKLKHVTAAINSQKKHNTGIYCHNIPHNPVTNVSTLDYKEAEERGYFKIDFLNVNIYKDVKDNDHLLHLMGTEPIWELLLQEEFVNLLFHINGHIDILRTMQPTCGTISCGPGDDKASETVFDWERMDYGDERNMGQLRQ